ncbi:hypothetical protein AAHE18_15G270700 [Arachis hypogaea]
MVISPSPSPRLMPCWVVREIEVQLTNIIHGHLISKHVDSCTFGLWGVCCLYSFMLSINQKILLRLLNIKKLIREKYDLGFLNMLSIPPNPHFKYSLKKHIIEWVICM